MTSKLILLIDMDGVVCEWYQRVLQRYQLANPHLPFVPEAELHSFDILDCYPPLCRAAICEAMESKGLFENLDPVPGAVEALKSLLAEHSDIVDPFLCSAPYCHGDHLDGHSGKARWVDEHLGRDWVKRMILTRDKTLVRGHVLIDDKPEITGAMEPTWQQLLYDRPWNQHVGGVRFTWSDLPQLMQSIRSSNQSESVI